MIEKDKLIKYLIIGFLFFSTGIVLNIRSCIVQDNYQFSGVLTKIDYSEKKTPTVTVNGKPYSLSTNWRFNERMKIGDTLVKKEGSPVFELIKFKTGEVVFSDK